MAFEPFTPAHWAGIGLAAGEVALLIGFRTKLRGRKADRAARWTMASVLAGSEVGLYVWYSATGNWGIHALPLQLCSITLWLSVAMLLTRSRKVYEIAFFLGVLGASQALATPNLDVTFPQFRYFHFFIAHAAIIGAGVYMTAVAGFRPDFRSSLRAWGWLNALAIPAAAANALTEENFMFLARKPDTASLLDTLAPWPWYILQLEVVAFALCLLLLGIVRLTDRLFGNKAKPSSSLEGIDHER